MISINDLLKEAKSKLNENEIDEREARLLLSFVLCAPKESLFKYKQIEEDIANKYKKIISKRCKGVPYAYRGGHKEFMKLSFIVNKNVLIPRDDTEILVEKITNIAKTKCLQKEINILDMCTGSGCIAISLAKIIKNSKIIAVDKSKKALQVARKNAKQNNVKIKILESDLFEKIENIKFDIIVSNPPYIETGVISKLQKEVKDNEPIMALDGGKDGLFFYRRITKEAKKYLKEKGILAYEIGYDQKEKVMVILKNNGFNNIEVIKDYSGNDRVIIAEI